MSFSQTVEITECSMCNFYNYTDDTCAAVDHYMEINPDTIHTECPFNNKQPDKMSKHPLLTTDKVEKITISKPQNERDKIFNIAKKAPYIIGEDIKDLNDALGQGGPFRWD